MELLAYEFHSSGQRKRRWYHRIRPWGSFSNHKLHHRLWVKPDHLSSVSDLEGRAG